MIPELLHRCSHWCCSPEEQQGWMEMELEVGKKLSPFYTQREATKRKVSSITLPAHFLREETNTGESFLEETKSHEHGKDVPLG